MSRELITHCPICGYAGVGDYGLTAVELRQSYFICACCGCEFGLDDNAEYRRRWIAGGRKWFSDSTPPPEGWDPMEQREYSDPRW